MKPSKPRRAWRKPYTSAGHTLTFPKWAKRLNIRIEALRQRFYRACNLGLDDHAAMEVAISKNKP